MDADAPLSEGELDILVDGLSDEVAFIYVMVHLGLDDALDAPPSSDRTAAVDLAIGHLRRLVDRGLVEVGHTEYVDGGPPGRLAPYQHVAEPSADVWDRLRRESLSTEPHVLDWSCWCANTARGDDLARRYVAQQEAE